MTTREQAMQWWNGLPLFVKESKHHYSDKYYPNRGHNNLTGSEIEKIWQKETKTENIITLKKLYNKQHDSYCTWNGTAYENDGKVPGAYFYGLEKAKNNGFLPIEENIYLNRLKEQYEKIVEADKLGWEHTKKLRENDYYGMRLFCLDTQLVSFKDIEAMEYQINSSFS